MKIRHVTDSTGKVHLVRSHTDAGARKYVTNKIGHGLTVVVPTQDELVDALKSGVEIEDATSDPQASIPEPNQAPE